MAPTPTAAAAIPRHLHPATTAKPHNSEKSKAANVRSSKCRAAKMQSSKSPEQQRCRAAKTQSSKTCKTSSMQRNEHVVMAHVSKQYDNLPYQMMHRTNYISEPRIKGMRRIMLKRCLTSTSSSVYRTESCSSEVYLQQRLQNRIMLKRGLTFTCKDESCSRSDLHLQRRLPNLPLHCLVAVNIR